MASGDAVTPAAAGRAGLRLRRRTAGQAAFGAVNVTALLLFCFTIVYPFWRLVLTSFAGPEELVHLGFKFWNDNWSTYAYEYSVSQYGNVRAAYFNSVLRVALGTVLTLACTLLMAYPLAKRDLPGRTVLTLYVVITLFFSGGLIPLYLVVRRLGLMDTRLALVLPVMANGFYIVIMRNFLMTLDQAYEEAALMDGANYLQVLVRIVAPLSAPVIAVVGLWAAVEHWNEWFHAMLFTKSRDKHVLQFLLRRMLQDMTAVRLELASFEEEVDLLPLPSVRAAVTVLTIGPIILIYPFIQRHMVKGIFIGSLKG